MSAPLPPRPDLQQLRRQAKELKTAAQAGEPAAVRRIRLRFPADPITLSVAQSVIAREYGFASWPRLVAEVRAAASASAAAEQAAELAEAPAAFLYASASGHDARAVRLLAGNPGIAGYDIHTAAVLGEVARVRELLAADPALATRPDPRSGWPPLLTVCESRWHRLAPARADGLTEVARLLLDAGADPNTTMPSRHGVPGQCSALAGAADNPDITRLLLARGAVADVASFRRASAFAPGYACLRLLLEHSRPPAGSLDLSAPIAVGSAEGVRLLLAAGADPNLPLDGALFREQYPDEFGEEQQDHRPVQPLAAAIEVGAPVELVELLLAHGADPNLPSGYDRSTLRFAVWYGRTDVADLLVRFGAR